MESLAGGCEPDTGNIFTSDFDSCALRGEQPPILGGSDSALGINQSRQDELALPVRESEMSIATLYADAHKRSAVCRRDATPNTMRPRPCFENLFKP